MNTQSERAMSQTDRINTESPGPATVPRFQTHWNLVSGQLVAVELLWQGEILDGLDACGHPLRERQEAACRQVATVLDGHVGDVRLCLPLEWLELALPGTVDDWLATLAAWGLKASLLSVLVPERRAATDGKALATTLMPLRAAGVEVILGGFGAGASSLSELRELPLDVIRIDRAVVPDIVTDSHDTSLTRSLIQLVHGLHMRVMADGVTHDDQLQRLVDHGCDLAQGDCFGAAQTAEGLHALLHAGASMPQGLLGTRPRRRTLLLVDDEAAILSSLKRLFRRDGYHILTATSGRQGLELLASQPVDVIVSDQRMPEMTGIEFLREAKRLYPNTVRLTLSGYTDLQSIIEAVNEGSVYKFLTKPWDDDLLRNHVAKAFEQSELAAENCRLGGAVHRANRELIVANQRLSRMARDESARRLAMQSAAGASRDALDGLPMAVFGIGEDGMLAYVNRLAVRQWPEWSSALGGDPAPSMLQLLTALGQPAQRSDTDGLCTAINGRNALVWLHQVPGQKKPLGHLMMVQLLEDAAVAAPDRLA
ncbi:EAL domain-containing protein [Hydrogenophaga taeniospiralis]|uniref:EAL domain-containing protein n=1 Tax=Hydrogenophaga taeniospiralis TaxID=65656 RepID=UPI001CFAA184|nr:EAL domain-containing protein [Hydrogenophaga taeniospiralis]MCB4363416.1 EAL domain-containing protein [Hydrogenophaga taeniospiralis]